MCQHYLASVDDTPAGTVRWRFCATDSAKIERLAVLEEFRHYGVGRALMQEILSEIRRDACIKIIRLSAQDTAISFYEKLGFKVTGNGYMDAGIAHHDMILINH